MKLLALDTSMQACSCALLVRDEPADAKPQIFSRYLELERGHAELLLPMIDEVMQEADEDIRNIDRFAVCRGPGTFTGVRIGIAAARGFSLACKRPLSGMSSLEVMAARAISLQPVLTPRLAVAVDARRSQVYWQVFNNNAEALGDPQVLSPEQAAATLAGSDPVTFAGSGARLVAELAGEGNAESDCLHPNLLPDAAILARIMADIPVKKEDTKSLNPIYLRPPDAKVQTGFAVERR